MTKEAIDCVRDYIRSKSPETLVGIFDTAQFCSISKREVYVAFFRLQQEKELKIIKRLFCPEFHFLEPEQAPYCEDCDLRHAKSEIQIEIYAQPLNR